MTTETFRGMLQAVAEEDLQRLFASFGGIGHGPYIAAPWRVISPEHIFVGDRFTALTGTRLEAVTGYGCHRYNPRIDIGHNVTMNTDCHVGCIDSVRIGDNVLLASRVYITDHGHGHPDGRDIELPPSQRELVSKGPVVIEDNVWIGNNVCVLSGVTVGRNSIVGANSVVTSDVPPYSVVAGAPARLIKQLK